MSAQKHPYHLVNPSPWPIVTSFSLLVLVVGGALALHKEPFGLLVVAAGVLLTGLAAAFWWRDVIHEGWVDRAHTPAVQRGLRLGMALFIISEVMFFAAFFWAYFGAAFFPRAPLTDVWDIAAGVWPPEGIYTFDPFDLPFLNTLILLLSATTLTWAHGALLQGNYKEVKAGLWWTVGLGAFFTLCQAYEYSHAAFGLTDGKYAATFFLATGFHGVHVIVGTIFLAVCLRRAYSGTLKKEVHLGFEFGAWYWHFVDVVWLFLFIGIYWLTS